MVIKIIMCMIIGYILGCIQNSYILVRIIKKVDIRELGSGNAGATNVSRILGFKLGVLAGFLDAAKAVLAIYLIRVMYGNIELLVIIGALACIVGHIFPFYLQFKGGKGVATTIGMLFGINIVLGFIGIAIIIIITFITNYVAAGSVLVYIALPFALYLYGMDLTSISVSIIISLIGIYKHKANIIRIINHNENGFRKK